MERLDTKMDIYPLESVYKFFQQGAGFCKQALLVGDGFPNHGWETNPAGARFPVEREEVNPNEKESPR